MLLFGKVTIHHLPLFRSPKQGKSMTSNRKRDKHISVLASLFDFTPEYIRMVLRGKRNNKAIVDAYNTLIEEEKKAIQKAKKHTIKAA
jgi:hypothetical protein